MIPITSPAVACASPSASVVWEETACPLCSHSRSVPFIEAQDPAPGSAGLWFAVVRCERCGLRFTNPRPAPESIAQFYSADYRPHRRPRQLRRPLKRWYPLGALRGRPSERRSLPWHGQGRLLDFGCGGGSFIARMAEQGWKVIGLDASVGVVQGIQEKLGLKALVGSLPHPELKSGTFDVVTMWHSLEHVHDPLRVLREAYQLLVPEGRLLIATPNIDSWPYRWFGRSWFGLDLPRHLVHFCPKSLRIMLECAGFRVVSLRTLRHSDWLRSSARLASRQRPTGLWARLLKLKPAARLTAWLCHLAGKSDCMLAVAERAG
jgi:2-polyprenyl-3-methyl-5-hydroxy-6-metoxy-1,4-benzoquinol methylase